MDSDTITVKVQAELDREYMYNKGEGLGLSEKALSMFRHFNFVDVTLIVNKKTGEVLHWDKSS